MDTSPEVIAAGLGVAGETFELRCIPKILVHLPLSQGKGVWCLYGVCDGSSVQQQRSAHAHIYPLVPLAYIPCFLMA